MGPHATLGTIPDSTATSGPKSCESVEIRERAASHRGSAGSTRKSRLPEAVEFLSCRQRERGAPSAALCRPGDGNHRRLGFEDVAA